MVNGFANRWFLMFNDTLPTSTGETSNFVVAMDTNDFANETSVPWIGEDPISGLVQGCRDKCKAKIKAPAVAVTSCASHQVSVDFNEHVGWGIAFTTAHGPPLSHTAFMIDVSLMMEHGTEKINLITGSAFSHDCMGVFNCTACTLESAIGEYEVTIEDDTISFDTIEAPTIVALANNSKSFTYSAVDTLT